MEDYGNMDYLKGKRAAAAEEEVDGNHNRDWENLPMELLTQILQHLYLDDVKSFHKVCKTWDSLEDPKDHDPLAFPVVPSQWLVHKDTNASTMLKFFHPVYGHGPHCIDIPELSRASLIHSHNGWLLFFRRFREIFFVNPFTNERVNLPNRPMIAWTSGIFLSEPTSPDCAVLGVQFPIWNYIFAIDRDNETWDKFYCSDDDNSDDDNNDDGEDVTTKFKSQCTPALHNGKLYALGVEGDLGVIDFVGQTARVHEVLGLPQEIGGKIHESYLVQWEGKLMAVFLSYMGEHICVLELEEMENEMVWKKVESLGDYMFFVSERSSFAAKKVIEGMENKIYFPRFHKQYIVFYCLETRLFKTFGSGLSQKDLLGTEEELVGCCWMQPSATRPYSPKPVQLDWLLDSSKDSNNTYADGEGKIAPFT